MQVREVFNGNLNLLTRLLPMYMEFVESLFYISQCATFKVLFATVRALETGHVIHNEKLAIVPINGFDETEVPYDHKKNTLFSSGTSLCCLTW